MNNHNNSEGQYYLMKELLAPYNHVAVVQEKFCINKIVRSFNYWLEVPEDGFQKVYDLTATTINGIFLIDDIQDKSLTRREQPTAHCVFGVALTLNSALQVMVEATLKAFELVPNGEAAKLLAQQVHGIWLGQGTEIYWIDNFVCPTEEQYKEMTLLKTGSFITLVVKLLQLLSKNKQDYSNLLNIIGYYIQLRDDYCNLCAQEVNKEDSFCEDLTEGKFSLPIIHASKTSVGHEVLRILRKRTRDVELKKYCLSLLEQAGSLQYTRDRLDELDRQARDEIARLGHNPILETALDELNSWRDDIMFT